MKQNTKRSQRRQEMLSKVEECLNSGENKGKWCSEHNISPAVYYYWQQEYYRTKKNSTGDFVELLPDGDNCNLDEGIQVTYPNGVSLLVPGDLSLEYLRTLIHLY